MASRSNPRNRQLLWLVAAIALAGAAALSPSWGWIASAESLSIDLRFQARSLLRTGERPVPASVIVGVADSTLTMADWGPKLMTQDPLAAMTASWPWNRKVFGAVVRRLRACGARAIVFDFVFDAENAGDAEFARALAEPGTPVVFASLLQADLARGTVTHQEPRAALLVGAANRVGYANVFPDVDGVLRTLTTSMQQAEFMNRPATPGGRALPSLAFAVLRAVRPEVKSAPRSGYIDFIGPSGTVPALPIEDLFIEDQWRGPRLRSGEIFRDRVVWVGMLSEVQFKDRFPTPVDGSMDGVEVQAQMFETLLGRGALRPFTPAESTVCGWGLALISIAVAWTSQRVSRQLAVVVGGAMAWIGLALGLFAGAGIVLPLVAPLGVWLVAGGGGVGVRFVLEQRARRRLRGVLSRYVSEEVAQIIADQPEEFSEALRGSRRPVTVLFADLRGFTSWVEKAEPEAFVAQLNEYFGAIVTCVLAEGGTLQKFIGDAVLTVWGDTRSAGAAIDTARAVDAALAMQAAVTRLNAGWAGRPDRTPMAIGIGLHHGVAMVGNVGHAQRMEFTVLGDVVNVAARLESANRQLDTTVLVSERVRDLIVDTHRCVALGRFGLKGRREAVGLFVPLGRTPEDPPMWLAAADRALAAWTAGRFSIAAAYYAELAREPSLLAEFFQQQAARAQRFAAAPPPDWNGEYRFDSK